ncbi:hypothetical protein EV421DRAFT_1144755 [Armillaria borealis]|uniref:Nephrocystin 3-like N-terminal domain-containing protein n=1 Tax=Armillaria borealis TaxID=47425 RepID=A0AA39J818_9AGAR|nr:hypothetical protein EV421DRAFT_1144755 [Armillaria borealis]
MIIAVQHDHFILSQAIDIKVNGVLDSINQIKQVTGRVDMNILEIRGHVVHIKDGVSQQQIQMQKAQDDDLSEKLSQRVGDTGCWFLESEQFQQWVDGSVTSSCLWCPGNPGVGKTILASIIINYLQSLDHKKKTLILSS